jgi:membrane protease YdiL (CAAX protease family)
VKSIGRYVWIVVWSGLLGLLITAIAGGIWSGLIIANIATIPGIPWAVAVMALVLWVMWQYLGGRWWPRGTSESRRRYLRTNRVSGRAFMWSLLAGALAMMALTGYWIVFFRLVKMRANALPDYSKYPSVTIVAMLVMGSLVSPISEEAGFRGYCQVRLEREFRAPVAVGLSSLFFMLAHLNHGLYWPKLLVYFLAGLTFGLIAYLNNSILPAIPVHIFGDLIFFTLVWPNDATRSLIREGGADMWFWVHTAQAIVFTGLAALAFSRLRRITQPFHGGLEAQIVPESARR